MLSDRYNQAPIKQNEHLGASDIVNGTPFGYVITEPEMETAFRNLMREIEEGNEQPIH